MTERPHTPPQQKEVSKEPPGGTDDHQYGQLQPGGRSPDSILAEPLKDDQLEETVYVPVTPAPEDTQAQETG